MNIWRYKLAALLRDNASRIYLIDAIGSGSLTYAELFERAAALAGQLNGCGVRQGDRVGIDLPNGAAFAILYFACLLGGLTAVPINNSLPAKDRDSILSRTKLAAVISAQGHQPADNRVPVLALKSDGSLVGAPLVSVNAAQMAERLEKIDDDSLLSIHFTSGTTSLPKGVPHRVGAQLGNAEAFNRAYGIGPDRRFVHVMPMAYMAGFLNTLLCALTAGASIVIAPQFTAQSVLHFWEPVATHAGDTIWVSPTMLATLTQVDRSATGIEYCRKHDIRIFSATAPLPAKVRDDFEAKYGVSVVESYGLSELLLITANLGPAGTKAGSVGRAIDEAELEIRAEDGSVLPGGSDGAIHVRTPYATVGYLNYDTGQPEPGGDEWVDTGDVGHIDADGYLFVTGRRKDLIIRGGFNVSPRQIEEAILHHPGVVNVAVVGAPHGFYGEEIVAAIILRAGHSLATLEPELRAACRRDLGPSSVPDRFVALHEFPIGNMGKIQKNKLRESIIAGLPA